MSKMVAIKKALLNERHLRPGRTVHTIEDKRGKRDFPPFVSLVITEIPEQEEFIMCVSAKMDRRHTPTTTHLLTLSIRLTMSLKSGQMIGGKLASRSQN